MPYSLKFEKHFIVTPFDKEDIKGIIITWREQIGYNNLYYYNKQNKEYGTYDHILPKIWALGGVRVLINQGTKDG